MVLSITRGADWSGQATFRDEATPLNLTGFTVTAVVAWAGGSFSEPSATRTPNRCGFALDSENSATPNLPVGLDINDWFVQV